MLTCDILAKKSFKWYNNICTVPSSLADTNVCTEQN